MIARQLFGRTGHQSTRTIFGGAALSKVTQDEAGSNARGAGALWRPAHTMWRVPMGQIVGHHPPGTSRTAVSISPWSSHDQSKVEWLRRHRQPSCNFASP